MAKRADAGIDRTRPIGRIDINMNIDIDVDIDIDIATSREPRNPA
jgi:hypothetical protein